MFDVGGSELLLIAVVALVVIGPKDLPKVMRLVGRYTGKARAMSRHLRSGFDEMMRQAELEEMEKQWAEHNRKIMEQTPTFPPPSAPEMAQPAYDPAVATETAPPQPATTAGAPAEDAPTTASSGAAPAAGDAPSDMNAPPGA